MAEHSPGNEPPIDKHLRLAVLEAIFEESGGRGVELADEIDALRRELADEVISLPASEYAQRFLGVSLGELADVVTEQDEIEEAIGLEEEPVELEDFMMRKRGLID